MKDYKPYYVVQRQLADDKFVVVISGLGKNKDTLDSDLGTKRTALKHARLMRKKDPKHKYVVETNIQGERYE